MSGKKNKSKNKKNKSAAIEPHYSQGTLDITRSGIGYVVIADGSGDVLVRPGDFNNALHGDTVKVKVVKENLNSGRKEGRITEVLHRKQQEFIGTLQIGATFAFFVADSEKQMPDFYVPLDKVNGAKDRDKVLVRMIRWEKDDKKPVGAVISVINAEDENDMAMKELLAEAGFPLSFPADVLTETSHLDETISPAEIAKRRDFRETLTFTIDPVDAKDFDDAISIKLLKKGLYEIGVHIADVSHFVKPGTALDDEAYKRATSVYLPDRVNPMLPEKISNELCSLRPKEEKLSFAAVFEVTEKGEVKKHWIGKTVIYSDHRFTYEDVQEMIEGKDGIYKEELLLLNKIAQKFRKERFSKGAINFSSQEVRFKLDEKGKPIGIVIKESKEAHQLIEEFMLLANRTVAEAVSKIKVNKEKLPFPYRIHDQPDEQKLTPFIAFARKFGHKFDISSPDRIASSFNQMLAEAKGKPEQHVLEQLGIRTMAKAVYTTDNIGHYGLGFEYYCHFTSPIRRYPDVLVHRVLEQVLANHPQVDAKMEEKCKHSSDRERAAMDCERAGNKYKQVEYMKGYLGEEFEGVVSGVASFGFWVETVAHKCEGLVSLASLSDYDDFRLSETDYALYGHRSGRSFRMGDKVTIRVIAANMDKRQLDYEWVKDTGATVDATFSERAQNAPRPGKSKDNKKFKHKNKDKGKKKEWLEAAPVAAVKPVSKNETAAAETKEPIPAIKPIVAKEKTTPVTVAKPAKAKAAVPAETKKKETKDKDKKAVADKTVKAVAPASSPAKEGKKAAVPAKKKAAKKSQPKNKKQKPGTHLSDMADPTLEL
ncbi:ribonuclease R [Filimonas lacunae]|uniref:Ribonuclease R n=1 Tax=Filimonas lacunae TaxID=477680 RepID=A0A173MG09_9BACT|nr:ribonuclease R [Filimonas lacunae]BAV06533.1 3'-to-5' exoribonuclease RNase R [Filimonas lacunae]SIT27292.1 ribonuclease R [Filimonas lacunae]